MKRLLIAGGGITGLSAAWRLQRAAPPGLEVTLLEREQRLGGKIRTDAADGYVLEQGPDSFLTTRPEAAGLCEELGISARLMGRVPRPVHTWIRHGHALSPLPEGFAGTLPMDTAALAMSPLLSEAGKRRALEEPSMPAWSGGDDESIASFMVRRLGEEVFQRIIEPFHGGIHAGDASLLSVQATAPHLHVMERARGSIAGPRTEAGVPPGGGPPRAPAQFLTFPGGTAELIDSLEKRLDGVRIQTGVGLAALRKKGAAYVAELSDGTQREADAVVLAIPAHEAAPLLGALDGMLEELLRLIPYASTVVLHLAYRQSDVAHALDGYGYLIPSVERSDLVACTWMSRKWSGRAPEDRVLLRLFAGRFGRRDLLATPDEELFAMARAEVAATLGITAAPERQLLHRWSMGMPQYTVGHLGRVSDLRSRAARLPGLFLAGAAYDGVGIPQCIASGTAAAAAVQGFFSD